MRKSLAALCVAAVVFVGYSLRSGPTNAQSQDGDWLPFTQGQSVSLFVDLPQGTITCKVTQVLNGFLGCAPDDQRRQAQWINLRFVKTITPAK